MKLELKHIVPYLLYEVKSVTGIVRVNLTAVSLDSPFVFTTTYLGSRDKKMVNISEIKPILRPLSDLINEIEVNGKRFVPVEWFEIGDDDNGTEYDHGNIKTILSLIEISKHNCFHDAQYLPYLLIQKLFEWHFDVFGLIEKGLAIDINTIES